MFDQLAPKFYARLRERRKRTQEAFGELFGKCRETVSSWERGQTRPSYEDERRLFESSGCSSQETLEIMSEVLTEISGRPVSLEFEDRGKPDHPEHPLTRAELLLQQHGHRLPARLCKVLERFLLKARANAALTERDNADALELVETWIEHRALGVGEEDTKRWGIFRKR